MDVPPRVSAAVPIKPPEPTEPTTVTPPNGEENKKTTSETSKNIDEMSTDTVEIKTTFKNDILTKYIYPNNQQVLSSLLEDKKFYEDLLPIIRAFKILFSSLLVPAMILSDTKFPNKNLSYIGAIFSFCVGLLEAGDLAIVRSNKKRLEKINAMLESIGIKYRMPDTTLDDTQALQSKNEVHETNKPKT
jgi:hypothetical protein